MTLDELRNLVRSKEAVAVAHGSPADTVALRSRVAEARHKRQPGACWAMKGTCAELRPLGRPMCSDSMDPRCQGA